MNNKDVKIQYIKGVGEKRAAAFARLGVFTLGDLIHFYPRAYENWGNIKKIDETKAGEVVCVKATCISGVDKFISKKSGITVYSAKVSDGEGVMDITIFNNRFAAAKLEYGADYLFFGKVEGNLTKRKMVNPNIEAALGTDKIRPIYPQTHGLNSTAISKAMKNALNIEAQFEEPFPAGLIDAYSLTGEDEAIRNIHFPESEEMLEKARKRLIFDELLFLQLSLLSMRENTRGTRSPKIENDCSEQFASLLPYELTGAQKRVIAEGVADLKADAPMSRLVQGDVGSGKTAVAMSLMYTCALNGFQSAMMAPTEILAEQHFKSINEVFEAQGIKTVLLTGSMSAKQKKENKRLISEGEADIVIGTHALIQGDVSFKNLALVIADEQHRFGVKQRTTLQEKGENVNLLVMSATPIPRTLALFIYGELDISVLDEMPRGRKGIETYAVDSSYHKRLYDFIKKEVDAGRQAYIVCPRVEEGEDELISATEYADKLKNTAFKNYSVGVLHGKMKGSEKESIMRRFKDGEIQILVATTVIEVGIDVPNASIMIIENAERYGLSQLHQLRGRIGRGEHKSYCVLVSDSGSDNDRLSVMKESSDGFKIADADLKLRGPGDFFGERQHGLVNLKIANLLEDMETLMETSEAAKRILAADPRLEAKKYAGLRAGVDEFITKNQIAVN